MKLTILGGAPAVAPGAVPSKHTKSVKNTPDILIVVLLIGADHSIVSQA